MFNVYRGRCRANSIWKKAYFKKKKKEKKKKSLKNNSEEKKGLEEVLYSEQETTKNDKKEIFSATKKPSLDDIIGAGCSAVALLAAQIPQNVIPMTLRVGEYVFSYLTNPAVRTLDLKGNPLSEMQIDILQKSVVIQADVVIKTNISAMVLAYTLYKFSSVLSSMVRDKEYRSLMGASFVHVVKKYLSRDNYISYLEKQAERFPIFRKALIQTEVENGNFDVAFSHMKYYLSQREQSKRDGFSVFLNFTNYSDLSTAYRRYKIDPENSATLFNLAAAYLRVGLDDQFLSAEEVFKELSEKEADERYADYNIVYALFLSARRKKGHEKTQEQWEKAARIVMQDPTSTQESIGETKNNVYTKGTPFTKGTILFKEKESRGSLEDELALTSEIRELIEGISAYRTIEHLAAMPIDNRIVSVMKREEGETLWAKILRQEPVYEDVENIAKYLALIHSRAGKSYPEEDTLQKVKRSLAELEIPNYMKDAIQANYSPLIASFQNVHTVINKDAHPENWLLGKGVIVCLDNDQSIRVPQVYDLVNLLEYGDYLSMDDKIVVIRAYITEYNKHSEEKIGNEETFIRAYMNAVIHRALCLSSAWSSPKRQSMRNFRPFMMQKALNAIAYLQENDSAFYSGYQKEYSAMEQNISQAYDIFIQKN